MGQASLYADAQVGSTEDLLREHLPLVKRIALHLKGRLPPDIDQDDLLQVGMLGLINAAENYDASQGASFATYASIRIRGEMLDEVRRSGWSPRSVQKKSRDVSEAIRRAEIRLGRSASDAEIAEELGVDLEEYFQISTELAGSQLVSLETEEEVAHREISADDKNPLEQVDDQRFRSAVQQAIEVLPEKEKLMMSLYYNEALNLREIGEVMGVSESRVSQIHGQALSRIRSKLSDWVE